MKRVLVSALLGVTLVATAAHAQDQWERVVRQQLSQVGNASEGRGYTMSHDIYMGRLDDDANTNLTLNLDAGKMYEIWGVCDQDCSDIDMVLYDDNDNEIDSDLLTDDKPLVEVTPLHSGRFRIKVTMANCRANPCRYGVGVWSKNGSNSTPNSANSANSANSTSSGSSSGNDQWEAVVRAQLNTAGATEQGNGYQMSHEIFMGRLDDDANESLTIPLDGGNEYVLIGACDQDCSDMDLVIYDPSGNEVSSDLATDDHPTLHIKSAVNGNYRLKVAMPACRANPCRYGVGVWSR
jgi:hypothetical protein